MLQTNQIRLKIISNLKSKKFLGLVINIEFLNSVY